MKKIYFNLLLFVLVGCSENINSDSIPDIFKTSYSMYKGEKNGLNFGDLVQIRNTDFMGVVCDISKDEGGIWYGIIFMDSQENLFSRSIPSGLSDNCIKLFDFTYLNQKGIHSVTKVSNMKLDFSKVGIGSRSTALNEEELKRDYSHGLERRKLIETPCEVKLRTSNSIDENFRNLKEIILR